MYREQIQRIVTPDERLGIYVAPALPAVKLGKLLMKETRVPAPGQVVAFFEPPSGNIWIILTDTVCYYPGDMFPIAQVTHIFQESAKLEIGLRNGTLEQTRNIDCKDEALARLLRKVLLTLHGQVVEELEESTADYSAFEPSEQAWLKHRDKTLTRIRDAYSEFNIGKRSLIQYEDTVSELLKQL